MSLTSFKFVTPVSDVVMVLVSNRWCVAVWCEMLNDQSSLLMLFPTIDLTVHAMIACSYRRIQSYEKVARGVSVDWWNPNVSNFIDFRVCCDIGHFSPSAFYRRNSAQIDQFAASNSIDSTCLWVFDQAYWIITRRELCVCSVDVPMIRRALNNSLPMMMVLWES